jgi:hypothetical protein
VKLMRTFGCSPRSYIYLCKHPRRPTLTLAVAYGPQSPTVLPVPHKLREELDWSRQLQLHLGTKLRAAKPILPRAVGRRRSKKFPDTGGGKQKWKFQYGLPWRQNNARG